MPFSHQIRKTTPLAYAFDDDGVTPNNPRLPLLVYQDVLQGKARDPAAVFEQLFAAHGWVGSWRNGVYDFLHFHTTTHEVLGIARGTAQVQFGGEQGRTLAVSAGDVVVLPAGTGHRRVSHSGDLLVVGAYPASGAFDQHRPGQIDHREALARVATVPNPAQDPVYGADGPLVTLWTAA